METSQPVSEEGRHPAPPVVTTLVPGPGKAECAVYQGVLGVTAVRGIRRIARKPHAK